ncbi:MAG: methionyl-tRNA formyltransferase [Clostridia bacterium]|nr:methionyl-tRNA formyltransferase [Clostridia bacterium]
MRILFMGTPDFALFSLRALVEAGEDVIGVVTQPDKPRGRGYTLTPPPVKVYALEKGLPVYQPATLRGEEFAALLAEIDPEVIVVVAFGKILPANVLEYPKYGCVNVHGSLLPAYRGAAPMQRAIIDGCAETGITTMMMDVGLDTGDMLLKKTVAIDLHDNFETVHDKLGECGAALLLETLDALEKGTAVRIPQDDTLATYAAKIEKEDCALDFSQSAKAVHDRIRGLSPIPLSFTHTPDGKMLKVVASDFAEGKGKPGEVISLDDGRITVACGEGAVALLTVLPEGKKRMSAADFINGRKISVGDLLN